MCSSKPIIMWYLIKQCLKFHKVFTLVYCKKWCYRKPNIHCLCSCLEWFLHYAMDFNQRFCEQRWKKKRQKKTKNIPDTYLNNKLFQLHFRSYCFIVQFTWSSNRTTVLKTHQKAERKSNPFKVYLQYLCLMSAKRTNCSRFKMGFKLLSNC